MCYIINNKDKTSFRLRIMVNNGLLLTNSHVFPVSCEYSSTTAGIPLTKSF